MQNLDAALFNDMILQKRKLLQSATTQDTRESKSKRLVCISSEFFCEVAAGCEHLENKCGQQKKKNKRKTSRLKPDCPGTLRCQVKNLDQQFYLLQTDCDCWNVLERTLTISHTKMYENTYCLFVFARVQSLVAALGELLVIWCLLGVFSFYSEFLHHSNSRRVTNLFCIHTMSTLFGYKVLLLVEGIYNQPINGSKSVPGQCRRKFIISIIMGKEKV